MLENCEWGGTVDSIEAKGDDHFFHFGNSHLCCENAVPLVNNTVPWLINVLDLRQNTTKKNKIMIIIKIKDVF